MACESPHSRTSPSRAVYSRSDIQYAANPGPPDSKNGRVDITQLLPRVTVPTPVIHEPAFRFGSFELCQEVAAAISGAEFLIVSEHSIAGRTHDQTVTGIDRFLRECHGNCAVASHKSKASAGSATAPNGLTAREVLVLRKVA